MKDKLSSLVDLGTRTKQFALRVIRVFRALPRDETARVLGKQLLRSGTSVGAHFREARRAKSDADFINKIEGALQELDESGYWMELLVEAGVIKPQRLESLRTECDELTAILVTVTKRTKSRIPRKLHASKNGDD
jgi:four helix bundle protein